MINYSVIGKHNTTGLYSNFGLNGPIHIGSLYSSVAATYFSTAQIGESGHPVQQTPTLGDVQASVSTYTGSLREYVYAQDYTNSISIRPFLIYQDSLGVETKLITDTLDPYLRYLHMQHMCDVDSTLFLVYRPYTDYQLQEQVYWFGYGVFNISYAYLATSDSAPATFNDVVVDTDYLVCQHATSIGQSGGMSLGWTNLDRMVFKGRISKKATVTSYHCYQKTNGLWVTDFTIPNHPYVEGETILTYHVTASTTKYQETYFQIPILAHAVVDASTIRLEHQYPFDFNYTDHTVTPATPNFAYTRQLVPNGSLVSKKQQDIYLGTINKWY